MKIHEKLIKDALAEGYKISVVSEEGLELKRSDSFTAIKAMVDNLGISWLRVWDKSERKGTAMVIPYDVEPHETIADYTEGDWVHDWCEANIY